MVAASWQESARNLLCLAERFYTHKRFTFTTGCVLLLIPEGNRKESTSFDVRYSTYDERISSVVVKTPDRFEPLRVGLKLENLLTSNGQAAPTRNTRATAVACSAACPRVLVGCLITNVLSLFNHTLPQQKAHIGGL